MSSEQEKVQALQLELQVLQKKVELAKLQSNSASGQKSIENDDLTDKGKMAESLPLSPNPTSSLENDRNKREAEELERRNKRAKILVSTWFNLNHEIITQFIFRNHDFVIWFLESANIFGILITYLFFFSC